MSISSRACLIFVLNFSMSFVAGIICGHIHRSKYPLFFCKQCRQYKMPCLLEICNYGIWFRKLQILRFCICTPHGMRRFARTRNWYSAFTTCKSVFPLRSAEEFKTFIIIVKQLIQLCFRYFFIKKRFHDRCIHCKNKKNSDIKKI